jgi:branched-chain amino acid transport system substrate-binding protein
MIAIGIAAILSGEYALLGNEMKNAAELAIEEYNAAGGIFGTAVSTYVVDDQASVEEGRRVARELCSRPDVLGVVGHFGSDVSIAASDIYFECGLATITPIASNPTLTDRGLPNVFRFTNRDDRTAQSIVGYLSDQLQKRRAVLIQSTYAYGKSMADQFSAAFVKRGGDRRARRNSLGSTRVR